MGCHGVGVGWKGARKKGGEEGQKGASERPSISHPLVVRVSVSVLEINLLKNPGNAEIKKTLTNCQVKNAKKLASNLRFSGIFRIFLSLSLSLCPLFHPFSLSLF